MIKKLVKHGHGHALVINKSLLRAARLKEDAIFQVIVNPNGGLLIQSVEVSSSKKFERQYNELSVELFELMKSLSKK